MTDLLDAVERLTREHKKIVHTVDGIVTHDSPALLEQLHDAIFGGMEKTGGAGSKAKLPISEAAADLYQMIDDQIAEVWAAVMGRIPSPLAGPERLVSEWAALVRDDQIVTVHVREEIQGYDEMTRDWSEEQKRAKPRTIKVRSEYTPVKLAQRWIDQIEDFLNPERTAGIKAPCIQCGERKITQWREGQSIQSDALVFRRDKEDGRTLDARCLACGRVWAPSQFGWLAEQLGLEQKPIVLAKPSRHVEWSGSEECFEGRHDECDSLRCRCEHHFKEIPG